MPAAPTDQTLRDYLLGQLPPDEVERIGKYLDEHPSAASTLAALQGSDTLLDALRARTALPTESELAKIVSRAVTLDDCTITAPSAAGDADLAALLGPAEAEGELGRVAEFRVLRVLGRGGMGAVFEAEDTALGRRVALKVMLPTLAASGTAKLRFIQEAKTAATVEHDHIVPIFRIGEYRGSPFLAMPLLAGETLDARLKREPLPLAEAMLIGRQTAEGLAAAHAAGLIHRDIKPSNIWLERHADGAFKRVRILDFGLAKAQSAGELTQSGAILGTPAYMAPEQARGEKVDSRADLFSLGVVLYEMTTGKRPFGGTDVFSMLTALATETPVAPANVSPALADLIMRLLSKDPAARPQSAKDVAAELGRVDVPNDPPMPATPVRRRNRRPVWIAAGALLFALVAAGAFQGKTIIRVVNNEGELVVQVDDPNVEVVVKGESVEIRREENGKKITYLVQAGKDGEVAVRLPGSDDLLLMEKFRVSRAGKVEVQVTNEKLAAAKPKDVPKPKGVDGAPKLPVGDSPPDKDAFPGTLVFHETFDDAKSVAAVANFSPGSKVDVANGVLTITGMKPKIPLAADAGPGVRDITFITRAKIRPLGFSVNFRIRRAAAKTDWLLVHITPGKWVVSRMDMTLKDGKPEHTPTRLAEGEDADLAIEKWVSLAAHSEGDRYEVWINSKRVAGGVDPASMSATAGGVAIQMVSGSGVDGTGKLEIDYAAVWDLSGPAASTNPAQRTALEAIFKTGARADILAGGRRIALKDGDPQSTEPLRVVFFDFHTNRKVTADHIALLPLFSSVDNIMLSRSSAGDAGFERFAELKELRILDVAQTGFGDASLAHVAAAPKLEQLHLSNTKVTAKGMAALKAAKNLKLLSLVELPVGDDGAAAIAVATGLETLNMEATGLGDAGLAKLAALTKLKELVIKRNPAITQAGFDKIAAALPNCKITWDARP